MGNQLTAFVTKIVSVLKTFHISGITVINLISAQIIKVLKEWKNCHFRSVQIEVYIAWFQKFPFWYAS